MRVIIIEDEPLIAVELEQVLEDAGFTVVGVTSTVEKAMALIAREEFDAVVLDANLAGQSAAPVAEALQRMQRAFVAISGYSFEQRPDAFGDAPFLAKPFNPKALVSLLRTLAKPQA